MIEYVDVGLVTYLRGVFPSNWTIVWAPPEISRQALANAALEAQKALPAPSNPPINTIGIPGLSVFRTSSSRYIWSIPMGKDGFPMGQFQSGPNAGEFNYAQVIPTKVIYTVSVWTEALSDLNDAERYLSFVDIFQAVEATIQGNTFNFPILWAGDVNYQWVVNEKTGKTLFYSLTKPIRIDTDWVRSANVPPIDTIKTIYRDLAYGFAFTNETLDNLNALPELAEVDIVANKADNTISIEPIGHTHGEPY
jgi:hypothetical protein